jgi:hypothetical protein
MTTTSPGEQRILRAIRAVKEGKESKEKCYFCGGLIAVVASPPEGPFSAYYFTCPCGKSNGFLRGI